MPRWTTLTPLLLAIAATTRAQDVPPPPPPGSQAPAQVPNATPPAAEAVPPMDLADASSRLADRLQDFADDVASDLPATPDSQRLGRDTAELSQAVRDFRANLDRKPDLFNLRQSFSGIDAGWNAISGEVGRLPNVPASLVRASKRIDQVEAQIRDLVGLNASTATFYNAATAPNGPAETVRLAAALADRSAAFASFVRFRAATLPNGAALAADAERLAREADAFHDSIAVDARLEVAKRAYDPVKAISDQIASGLATIPNPPAGLAASWSSYATARSLLEQNLGLAPMPPVAAPPVVAAMPARGFQLNVPGANIRVGPLGGVRVNAPGVNIDTTGVAAAYAPVSIATVQAQAQILADQVNEFIAVWGPTAGQVPLGGLMLSDAGQLKVSIIDFQRDIARGLDARGLAYEFRDIDLIWQRLARRVNRVARGRMGPNIAQVDKIGETISAIHRTLAMPGYPPVVDIVP